MKFWVPVSVTIAPEIEESEILTVVFGSILPLLTALWNSV